MDGLVLLDIPNFRHGYAQCFLGMYRGSVDTAVLFFRSEQKVVVVVKHMFNEPLLCMAVVLTVRLLFVDV